MFGRGFGAATITGGVLSTLIGPTVAVAMLPARSTAIAVRHCPAPSAWTTCGVEPHCATADTLSEHVNVTVTSVLFQPKALGAGVRVPTITGGVLSTRTTTACRVGCPDEFVTEQVSVVTPSAPTVTGSQPVDAAIPAPGVTIVQFTVTSVLFQPSGPGLGEREAAILGACVCRPPGAAFEGAPTKFEGSERLPRRSSARTK